MNKNLLGAGVIIIVASFFSLFIFLTIRGNNINRNYEFNGVVEDVNYDIKGTPSVTISGHVYYLSYNNWNFQHRIMKMDTLIKKKGYMKIILIKYSTHEKIILD